MIEWAGSVMLARLLKCKMRRFNSFPAHLNTTAIKTIFINKNRVCSVTFELVRVLFLDFIKENLECLIT